jgi:hypothetical protein
MVYLTSYLPSAWNAFTEVASPKTHSISGNHEVSAACVQYSLEPDHCTPTAAYKPSQHFLPLYLTFGTTTITLLHNLPE